MPFRFFPQEIPGVILVEPEVFTDERGSFMESYKWSDFRAGGITDRFVQEGLSRSARGVLRGLHFQKPPAAQGKLVSVVTGEIFDVAADIRAGSPTYGRWIGKTLSAANGLMLYLPPGFAHGFCVTSDAADILYRFTTEYSAEMSSGIAWNDPDIGVSWPTRSPLLSASDRALPLLRDANPSFSGERLD